MKTTRPLPDWNKEQPHLQAILAEEQDKAFMNAETEHRPAIVVRRLSRPLDVDERATPGTMPVTRPTVTTAPTPGTSVRDTSGDLRAVNFYVPPLTQHMHVISIMRMHVESFKQEHHCLPDLLRLSYENYKTIRAMRYSWYAFDGTKIPLLHDKFLLKPMKSDEVECLVVKEMFPLFQSERRA